MMDEIAGKILEGILTQVGLLNGKIDRLTLDLGEFSERFEEIMEQIEHERRLDRLSFD